MENGAGLDYDIDNIEPYDDGDFYDQSHPNASGYAKMAQVWFDALKLILPAGTFSAPIFSETNIDITGYVNIPINHQAIATGVGTPTYSIISGPGMINNYTGRINWTPTTTGVYNITIEATNGTSPDAVQNLTVHVLQEPTLPTQLISYWRFDEDNESGPFTDAYNLNNGYTEDSPSSITGQVNGAYSLNGSDKLNVLDSPDLNFTSSNNSFTAEAWINISGGSGNRVVMGKYGRMYDESYWWFGVDNSGQAIFTISQYIDPARYTSQFTGNVIGSGWHHIAVVKNDGSTVLVYVDGAGSSSASGLSAPFVSLRPLNIGHLYNGSNYTSLFNGSIDEVALYNGALDQATIMDHYNRGKYYNKGYFDQFVLVKTKIFLEGPYFANGDTMSTLLKINNYIPFASPYSQDPRTVDSIPTGVVDWVLIEVRNSSTSPTVVGYRSAFLKKDGYVVGDDGTSDVPVEVAPGNYYIVIRHRNHLAVMSKDGLPHLLSNHTTPATLYDFTTGSGQFYGTNGAKELETGVWGMWAGDVNGDGILKYSDIDNDRLQILIRLGYIQTSTTTGYYNEDLNMDGEVRYSDINNDRLIILENLDYVQTSTKNTQVPN
jgi:hypothetical protein